MTQRRSVAAVVAKLVGFAVLAFGITTLAGGIWAALLVANLRSTPAVPWSVPVMGVLLWLAWSYLGGKGPPRSTFEARRHYLRANPLPRPLYFWAWTAGGLSLVALSGLWIVLFQLVRTQPNLFADTSAYPRLTVALLILVGSLVAPLMEEASFRGYFQVALEGEFRPAVAIAVSSIVFALAHAPTQGFAWPKLLFYFLVGVTFGVIAYLTNSTLPAIPVHIAGLLIFFTLIWPHDAGRRVVWEAGADKWFWIHVAQTIVFGLITVLAFRRLAATRNQSGGVSETALPISSAPISSN
jgi:membrane protease YdiL (CAAX protease family)